MNGVVETAGKLGTSIVQSLPAQFLLLALVNVVFILGLLWYLAQIDDNRSKIEASRMSAITPVMMECVRIGHEEILKRMPIWPPPSP